MKITSLGIVGFGGMGQLVKSAASSYLPDSCIRVFDPAKTSTHSEGETVKSDLVIFCVNDENLEGCLQSLNSHLNPNTIYITISAIMTHSHNCIKSLPGNLKFIISHPLFGPASYQNKGQSIADFKIAVSNHSVPDKDFDRICAFIENLNLKVIKTTPAAHDQFSARDHFIPYLLSHVLKDLSVVQSEIRTYSAEQLLNFLDCTSYSKAQLKAMYKYNPYVKEMISSLDACLQNTLKDLKV